MKRLGSAGVVLLAAFAVVSPVRPAELMRPALARLEAVPVPVGAFIPVAVLGAPSSPWLNPAAAEIPTLESLGLPLRPAETAAASLGLEPAPAEPQAAASPDSTPLVARSPGDPASRFLRAEARAEGGAAEPALLSGVGRSEWGGLFDGGISPAGPDDSDLEVSLDRERTIAMSRMFYTLTSLDGVRRGAVPASPSRRDPDYWYHWKRDAGIVMTAVARIHRAAVDQGRAALTPDEKHTAGKWIGWTDGLLRDYAVFSRDVQFLRTQWDLGDVKMHLDGTAFTGGWFRPQNDGPALSAIALTYLAETLLRGGRNEDARKLYDGRIPTDSVIKADLEYVAHHWRDPDVEPWEEVLGHHFFNRMVQRRALLDGARLARAMGDGGAAEFYELQARLLEPEIEKHWDERKDFIVATLDRKGGLDYKGGLDSQVLMAALYGDAGDGFFGVTDDRILATAAHIRDTFKDQYPINRIPGAPGVAIGRYPEDVFYGGNPWVIATNALAQLHYKAGSRYIRAGTVEITERNLPFFRNLVLESPERLRPGLQVHAGEPLFAEILAGLKKTGDSYLERVRYHANPDGSLSEQMEKNSGFMLSARDLTWNYETYLTTMDERLKFVAAMKAARPVARN